MNQAKIAPDTVNNAPTIGDNSPHAVANIYDRSSMILAVISLAASAFASGMVFFMFLVMPSIIDAKVAAGVAKAEQVAASAKQDARVALDKVEQTQVQLGARGLVQPSTH